MQEGTELQYNRSSTCMKMNRGYYICLSLFSLQRPEGSKVAYIPWDFNFWAKQRGSQILTHLAPIVRQCLQQTSFFLCGAVAPATLDTNEGKSNVVRRYLCIPFIDLNLEKYAECTNPRGLSYKSIRMDQIPG